MNLTFFFWAVAFISVSPLVRRGWLGPLVEPLRCLLCCLHCWVVTDYAVQVAFWLDGHEWAGCIQHVGFAVRAVVVGLCLVRHFRVSLADVFYIAQVTPGCQHIFCTKSY